MTLYRGTKTSHLQNVRRKTDDFNRFAREKKNPVPKHQIPPFLKLFDSISAVKGGVNATSDYIGIPNEVRANMVQHKLHAPHAQKIFDAYHKMKGGL